MEMDDAAWLPSTSLQAAAAEQRYRDILAGKLFITPHGVAQERKQGRKKKEKKKNEEESARRRCWMPRCNYFIWPSTHPSFFSGRATDLYVNGQKVSLVKKRQAAKNALTEWCGCSDWGYSERCIRWCSAHLTWTIDPLWGVGYHVHVVDLYQRVMSHVFFFLASEPLTVAELAHWVAPECGGTGPKDRSRQGIWGGQEGGHAKSGLYVHYRQCLCCGW